MINHEIPSCPICDAARTLAFRHTLLKKHVCDYYHCADCGLLQTQEPHWIDEAYGSAISRLDTGVLSRNIRIADILSLLMPYVARGNGRFLDVAGGYGILTRLMRDRGFDFHWSDKYCENLFARGFEGHDDLPYDVISAFEVLEHVTDPVGFVSTAMNQSRARTLVFSTELYTGSPPAPDEWWYYAFESGQHVSFYQRRTLHKIAERLGLKCFAGKSIHVLTDKQLSPLALRLLTNGPFASMLSPAVRVLQRSRTMSDHVELSER